MLYQSEQDLIKIFGQQMREARELAGYRQNQAAELLGLSPLTLKSIEDAIDIDQIILKTTGNATQTPKYSVIGGESQHFFNFDS